MNFKKGTILSFLLLFLIFSCRTVSFIDTETVHPMSVLTSYPSWWENNEKSNTSTTFFYIEALGSTSYLARLDAYNTLLDEVSETLQDESIKGKYIAELVSTNKIGDLSLYVDALSLYKYSDTEIECILKASVSNASLFSKTLDLNQYEEDMNKVNELYNTARQLYRENDDLTALDKFLEAALILEKYIQFNTPLSFDDVKARILRIVKNAYITISKQDEKNATCTLLLKRRIGIIHPNIKKGEINAEIPSVIKDNNIISYTTGPGGVLKFSLFIYDAKESGDIRFTIKEPSLLSRFESEEGQHLVEDVREAILENAVEFHYSKGMNDRINLDTVLLFLDRNDSEVILPSVEESFKNELENKGIDISYIKDFHEGVYSSSDIISLYSNADNSEKSSEKNSDFLLIIVATVDDITPLGRDRAMHISFDVSILDKSTDTIIFKSEKLDRGDTGDNEINLMRSICTKELEHISKIVEATLK